MAWQKRDTDLAGPMMSLAGPGLLAIASGPDVWQTVLSVSMAFLTFIGIVSLGLIVFGLCRLASPERHMHTYVRRGLTPSPRTPEPKPDEPETKSEPEPAAPAQALSTAELIERLHALDWFQFEKLVGHIYRKLGYTVVPSRDGQIDLVIQRDSRSVAVQCRQANTERVGVKAAREFVGALAHAEIRQGKCFALRGSTNQAVQFAGKNEIEIVDENGLAQLLESAEAGSDPEVLELLQHSKNSARNANGNA